MNEKPDVKDKIGDRIGVIASATETDLELFGYGVRLPDEIPVGAVGPGAEMIILLKRKNPCFLLDSGQKVYGCEAWWAPEDVIKKIAESKRVVYLDIEKVRKEVKIILNNEAI